MPLVLLLLWRLSATRVTLARTRAGAQEEYRDVPVEVPVVKVPHEHELPWKGSGRGLGGEGLEGWGKVAVREGEKWALSGGE